MIAQLVGEVVEHDNSHVVISCGGIGYGVLVCYDDQQTMRIGSIETLFIAEQIKEDTYDLFGFKNKSRRQLFELLRSVNGVGPKAAMAILNIGNEANVRQAIATGDIKLITAAHGIGKKVAERVVVDLKNKVGLPADASATDFITDTQVTDEAVLALVALGKSTADALELLRGVDAKLATSERVKQALRGGR